MQLFSFSISFFFLEVITFSISVADDRFTYHNGMQFSTKDRDHDTYYKKHCAQEDHGAWWYKSCSNSNLNGKYDMTGTQGTDWWTYGGRYEGAEMKIRPMK